MSNRPGRKIARQQSTRQHVRPSSERAERQRNRTFLLVGVVGLVVVGGVLLALGLSGGSSGDPQEEGEVGFAEVIGTSLPQFNADISPDPGVGLSAPTLIATTFDAPDQRTTVEPGDGTAKLLGFFAHWCPHCQAEVPRIASWVDANGLPDGVDLVAVSTSVSETAPNYPPSEWFEREGWPSPVLVDTAEGALATGYGLTGFPYWVAVDADGQVVARLSGELSEAQFVALLDAARGAGGVAPGGDTGESSPAASG